MRRVWKKIRYRVEWLGLKFAMKFVPLLSRTACYRLALLLGSLGAMLDRRGRRVALSNLRVAFGDEISSERPVIGHVFLHGHARNSERFRERAVRLTTSRARSSNDLKRTQPWKARPLAPQSVGDPHRPSCRSSCIRW